MKEMKKTLPSPESGLVLHDRLPERHPYCPRLEQALRTALRGLPGSWDVSIIPQGRRLFTVEVVAPDAFRWSAAVAVPEGARVEDLADIVRAACARRCPVKPPGGPAPVTEAGHSFPATEAAASSGDVLREPAGAGRGTH